MNASYQKTRLLWIALTIFILFSFLIAQFYQIQITEGDKWTKQALKQHFFVVKEPFVRGTFYSNTSVKKGHPPQNQPFAVDVPKYHLYIDPLSIPTERRDEISEFLHNNLNHSIEERLNLRSHFDRECHSRKLAMWLDKETHRLIQEWWTPFCKKYKIPRNSLFFVKDYQRSYPFGKLLGQVLHTIQNIKDEKTQRALPTGGLELSLNKYLHGTIGKRRLMRSPRHSFETGEVISHPKNGADVYLTINHYLQAIAEEEIERAVKKCNAKCGWAVMLEPRTGEILAIAQYPFFNLSDYQCYFNDPQLIENTKVKSVTDAYEPGSVMKPFTLAVALKANETLRQQGKPPIFSPDDKIDTRNGRFAGRSKPIRDTKTHYFLNMDMAIWKSSNIYMARLAEKIIANLGNNWYRDQLIQTFGFGTKTEIELPAESNGVLPMPGKRHPNGSLEWSVPTPFSLAMGHNIQVTSLQLARAYSVLANGGYLVQPTLIRKIIRKDENGEEQVLIDNTNSERMEKFPKVLDAEVVKRLIKSMRSVTKMGGTAVKGDVHGYTEAGKTGTANKIVQGHYSEKLYCASFAGFTPVNNPAFVLVVTMDEPEYGYIPGIGKNHNGGNCTAGAFRDIAKRSLEYLGIPSDDPYGYPYGDPRYDSKKADWVTETKLLQELYDKWNSVPKK